MTKGKDLLGKIHHPLISIGIFVVVKFSGCPLLPSQDRIIIATTIEYKAKLASVDGIFRRYPELTTLLMI